MANTDGEKTPLIEELDDEESIGEDALIPEPVKENAGKVDASLSSHAGIEVDALIPEPPKENAGNAGKIDASLPSHPGIEGDESDPCEQIAFMVGQLSRREKRRTLQLLGPDLEPLLSSTQLHGDEEISTGQNQTGKEDQQQHVHYTSASELTLAPNTSVSKIVFQAPQSNLPKLFSGIKPIPKGEVDFRTWVSAARRLKKHEDLNEEVKCEKLQNSLLTPALNIVRSALDAGKSGKVISLLTKAYDDVKDVRDIRNEFNASLQLPNEKDSDFLTRLYLLLHEVNRKAEVEDFDGELLKQFLYGSSNDHIIMRLRLQEKDDEGDPPEYGSLLLNIRREENKIERKKACSKGRMYQQTQAEDDEQATALHKEVESLRKEVAQLKQHQTIPPLQAQPAPALTYTSTPNYKQTSTPSENKGKRRKPLHFCFKCGLDNHKVWTCANPANPALVTKKFEMAKQENAGNFPGSR